MRSITLPALAILALARAHGARVAFATQANDWSDYEENLKISIDAQRDGMARMTETLRRVGEELGVLVLEAQPILERVSAQRRAANGEEIFTHEVHLTDAGADLLAQLWARKLLQAGMIP